MRQVTVSVPMLTVPAKDVGLVAPASGAVPAVNAAAVLLARADTSCTKMLPVPASGLRASVPVTAVGPACTLASVGRIAEGRVKDRREKVCR